MSVFAHGVLPVHTVPRIQTRILIGDDSGATSTTIWEQWIEPGGHIPLHYHEVEEVLVLLSGSIELVLGDKQDTVQAPATILVAPRVVHGVQHVGTEQVHLLAMFPEKSPQIFEPTGKLRPLPWEDTESLTSDDNA